MKNDPTTSHTHFYHFYHSVAENRKSDRSSFCVDYHQLETGKGLQVHIQNTTKVRVETVESFTRVVNIKTRTPKNDTLRTHVSLLVSRI